MHLNMSGGWMLQTAASNVEQSREELVATATTVSDWGGGFFPQYTNSVFAVISGQGNEFVEDIDPVAER